MDYCGAFRTLHICTASCVPSVSKERTAHLSHARETNGLNRSIYWPTGRVTRCQRTSEARRRGRHQLHASTGDDFGEDDKYLEQFGQSELFNSDVVQKEFENIATTFKQVSQLRGKFADFDIAGKEMYLEQMGQFAERLRVFTARCKLSDDAAGNELMRRLNAQCLEAGMNIDRLYDSVLESTVSMRSWVEAEKALSPTDFEAQIEFKRQAKQAFTPLIDFQALMEDPEVVEGLMDPQAMNAVREVMTDPLAAERWRDHPRLGPLTRKVARLTLEARFNA